MIRIKKYFLFLVLVVFSTEDIMAQGKSKPVFDSLILAYKRAKDDVGKLKSIGNLLREYVVNGQFEEGLKYANDALSLINRLSNTADKASPVTRKNIIEQSGDILDNIAIFNADNGNYDEALKYWSEALNKFEEIGDKISMAHILHNISACHYIKGNYDEALRNVIEGAKIARELGDKKMLGDCNNGIAAIYVSQGNYTEALKLHLENLKVRKELGDKMGIATTYHNIAGAYKFLSDYSEALKNYSMALTMREEIGDKTGIAITYKAMGQVYQVQGNYPEALKSHQSSLKIMEETRNRSGSADVNIDIGIIRDLMSDYPEALKNYRNALKIKQELGEKGAIANIYNNIGIVYRHQGNYPEALKNYAAGLELRKEIGDKAGIAGSYSNLGVVYDIQGNYAEALKNYQAALKIREQLGDKHGIADSYINLGSIYSVQGNYTEALKSLSLALKIKLEIGDKLGIGNCYDGIANQYYKQQNYSESLKYNTEALKIFEELGDKSGVASSLWNIGGIYKDQGSNAEALNNFFRALKITGEIGDKLQQGIISCYIGEVLVRQASAEKSEDVKQKKFNESFQYLNKALSHLTEVGAKDDIKSIYLAMSEAYRLRDDYKKALEYHNLYVSLKDSLLNNETTRKLEQQRTQYEVEKAVAEEKVQQEKVLAEQRIQKEKAIEIEKLKYQVALTEEHAEQEKLLAAQQFESERKLSDENAKHIQAIADERSKQQIKDAEAKTLLEKEKVAKKRRTEAFGTGLAALFLISIFTIIIIRQRNQKRRAVEKAEAGHKMAELELQSLRAQLNPHFMFNSLNAIQDLIVNENSEKSHLYLSRFSKLLRMLLDNANHPFVTVKQELELLELYLSLENLRIPNLQYSIEKDPKLNADERMIPNMMLQPYIENAIWHGLSNKKGERKLQIRIHDNGTATEFEVEDNGIGRRRSEELKQQFRLGHHSKGMQLLSKRFELLSKEYGSSIQTTITDLENNGDATGTLVKIDVPFSLSEQANHLINDTNHHN